MSENWGDALARKVSARIAAFLANEAALASVPSQDKDDGRLFICLTEGSLWIYVLATDSFKRAAGAGSGGLYTCGTGVAVGEWVYISAANTVAEADADDTAKRPAIGVVVAKPSTTSAFVQTAGEYTTSGLTAGSAYYLSAATAGAITATPPPGNAQLVGWAKSTTVLVISPQVAAFATAQALNFKRTVRGVVYSNVADLSAFTVASDDGITYAETDRVALVAQTTGAQCGIYTVGAVGGGTAALTRAADMPSGLALPLGFTFEVGPEGTYYKNSTWKATATTTGGAVIGTNDPLFYPKVWKQTVTLASGTYTIGVGSTATPDEPLFLLSTTGSTVVATRDTVGGTVTTTIMYVAPVASRIAGKAGTAAVEVRSAVAAGTILNTDNSTVSVLITNW